MVWCFMVNQKQIDFLEQELKNVNAEIEKEKNNLIYMLTNMEIEDIDIYNFYLKIKDLIFQKKLLKNKIFDAKIE